MTIIAAVSALLVLLDWLRRPIRNNKPVAPWPGFFRASWRFMAGHRRAEVIQRMPAAAFGFYRLVAADRLVDWRSGRR